MAIPPGDIPPEKWSEALTNSFFHQVTFTMILVCYQSCALKKKCETLGEGLGPWSLALPYFNSEDSKIYHLKSNSSKCCFLLSLSSREQKPYHCFREKKKEMEKLFSKYRCSFLVILYMMMSQLVGISKRRKFCHLYACYAYF